MITISEKQLITFESSMNAGALVEITELIEKEINNSKITSPATTEKVYEASVFAKQYDIQTKIALQKFIIIGYLSDNTIYEDKNFKASFSDSLFLSDEVIDILFKKININLEL